MIGVWWLVVVTVLVPLYWKFFVSGVSGYYYHDSSTDADANNCGVTIWLS